MMCAKDVTNKDSAAGKRARVAGATWTAEAASLGMEPQFLLPTESYEALQRGILDCMVLAPTGLASLGIWEVAKYFVDVPYSAFPGTITLMNLDRWNELPDELKQILTEASVMAMIADAQAYIDFQFDFAQNAGPKHDVVFNDTSELAKLLLDAQTERLATMPQLAPPSLANAQEVVDQYLGYLEKWAPIVAKTGAATETVGFLEDATAATTLDWQPVLRDAMMAEIAGKYAQR